MGYTELVNAYNEQIIAINSSDLPAYERLNKQVELKLAYEPIIAKAFLNELFN
jgi:hypothetical protein